MTQLSIAKRRMRDAPAVAIDRGTLLAELTELVEALDRRTPSLERAGELRILKEAAALRREAEMRIAGLKAGL